MTKHLNWDRSSRSILDPHVRANHTRRFQAFEPDSQMVRFSPAASSHRLPSGKKKSKYDTV